MSNYHVLFVGLIFPEHMADMILDQEIRPVQTQRFGMALLDALRKGFNNKVEVLSSAPLLDYPHSRFVVSPSAKWMVDDCIPARMAPYVNIVGIKHLTRFISTLVFVIHWVLRNRGRQRVIVLHGVQSCKLWAVNLVQALTPSTTVSFLTDDIGIPLKWEKPVVKKMRLLDISLMKHGMKRLSGIISMTPQLARKLAPGKPVLCIPAIQNARSQMANNNDGKHDDGSFTIAYTGGLSYDYGIDLLLSAFEKANRPNWRLKITGWGALEKEVRNFAEKDARVQYLGFLPPEGILDLYRSADLLVTPKRISSAVAELSFPSKIVEYLSTGKPVVSTDLPVFDDRFRKHLIIAGSDSPEELCRRFEEVSAWDPCQIETWRTESIRFVQQELSADVQGRKIFEFIKGISE